MNSTENISSHDEPARYDRDSRRRLWLVVVCCAVVGIAAGFGVRHFTIVSAPAPDQFEIKSVERFQTADGYRSNATYKINKRTGETWKQEGKGWIKMP